MATVVDTRATSRGRTRVGRRVRYNPTAAEVAVNGAGPYSGTITRVNLDGTVDLMLSLTQAVSVDLNEATDAINALSKTNVRYGEGEGQFSYFGI